MTTIRLVLAASILAIAASVSAQTERPVPGNTGAAFVEQADPGALCPSCQVLLLRDAYAPPAHINPYGPPIEARIKPTADVLVYDGATGMALLVKTTPYGYVPGGYSVLSIFERVEWVPLRAGMFWTTGDLDGDGRDDLVGHDKRTGEIVRVYRRDTR